ncbi:MAG: hypothetical protein IKN15_11315 [Bacteroidaceae bacterium]|nr:hypothetical protein [Bacteroidaceae bacterium]
MSRKYILLLIGCWLLTVSFASVPDKKPEKVLPVQEKVYLHFDNNCYFLGDTIWYKAYVVLADDNSPEPLSRILYVELLNEQGYPMERQQLVVNENGQADGCFAISDTTFAGYYEVRAYTKWMLNFGYEPVPSWYSKSWLLASSEDGAYPIPFDQALMIKTWHGGELPFKMDTISEGGIDVLMGENSTEHDSNFSIDRDGMERNYRLYNNLFSRVIPVYSRPDTAANYMQKIMPTKITMGDYTVNWLTPEFDVKFYPEGGYLLEGQPCRIAWEAMNQELERLNVRGVLLEDDEEIDSLIPFHAGRGMLTLTPQHGKKYRVRFEFGEHKFTFKLPEAEQEGARLMVEQDEEGVYIDVAQVFTQPQKLSLNIYCRGKAVQSFPLSSPPLRGELEGGREVVAVYKEDLPEGVNQAVLTDEQGNVYADRLFFINRIEEAKGNIIVAGVANRPYRPLEKIKLNLIATDPKGSPVKNQTFSVSVRDEAQLDPTFATGNIMTNLLLESEIKGFVENPDYYFESNDEKHQKALDLLLMIQGWRRYDWHDVVSPSEFKLQYLPEQKMVIYGNAMPLRRSLFTKDQGLLQITARLFNTSKDLKKGETYLFEGNVEADTAGYFQIPYEPFYGTARLSLRAKFVKKLEKKNYDKVEHDEKIFLRKQYFYPQGLKAYSWYETHNPESFKDRKLTWEEFQEDIYASEWIPQVNIRAKRRPHAKRQRDKLVYSINFLDLVNDQWDQGYYNTISLLDNNEYPLLARQVLIDGFVRHQYETQYNTHETHITAIDWSSANYIKRAPLSSFINNLKELQVVSDAPRRPTPYEHFHQDRQEGPPTTGIDAFINITTYPKEERRELKGREYNFQGFTRPVEYYNPDYSKAKLPEIKDYRRTLYWNPNVTTDNFGQASIEFYNNSVCNIIDVSAEGITRYGQFLVNE